MVSLGAGCKMAITVARQGNVVRKGAEFEYGGGEQVYISDAIWDQILLRIYRSYIRPKRHDAALCFTPQPWQLLYIAHLFTSFIDLEDLLAEFLASGRGQRIPQNMG